MSDQKEIEFSCSDFPDFGKSIRNRFCINENHFYFNSGENGITTKALIEKKFEYFELMEKNTDMFVRHMQLDFYEECKKVLSKVLRSNYESLVFNENSIESLNCILKSILNKQERPVLIFDFLAPNKKKILKYHCDCYGIDILEIPTNIELLNSQNSLIQTVENFIKEKEPSLFLFEHIAEITLNTPVTQIAKLCLENNVLSLVDGSCSFGQIHVDLGKINPDFYYFDCHSWGFNPKSVSVLYVRLQLQEKIHPANISVYNTLEFSQKFRYLGTRDVSSVLCVKDSNEFLENLGRERISLYNHILAIKGTDIVQKIWNTKSLILGGDSIGAMFAVAVPETFKISNQEEFEIMLIKNHDIYIKLINYNNTYFIRFCCQIINDLNEIEKAAYLIREKVFNV